MYVVWITESVWQAKGSLGIHGQFFLSLLEREMGDVKKHRLDVGGAVGGGIYTYSGPSVEKVICFWGQQTRGLRMIENSEITHLDRILMDGFFVA